jgi:folate-dependent phosphoribosylglycinamide formyltransferase PurN
MDKKIIMILEDGSYAKMVYNHLKTDFDINHIIIDNGQGFVKLLKRRIKKLGIVRVIGQVLFRIVLVPYLNFSAKKRISGILDKNNIEEATLPPLITTRISSINSKEGHDLLKKLNPDIVAIVSHRIVSKKTLELTKAKFINIHAGITPLYRGLHGGYWALINNDINNCGVTVHLLDEGIDTGGILYQDTITDILTKEDNLISYIYLQLAKALPLLKKSIRDVQTDAIKIQAPKCEMSKNLYYQPTFWFYLYNRWFRNIR